jgi:hypothetical protein
MTSLQKRRIRKNILTSLDIGVFRHITVKKILGFFMGELPSYWTTFLESFLQEILVVPYSESSSETQGFFHQIRES